MADIPQTLALLNLPDELIELVFTQLHPLAVVLCRQASGPLFINEAFTHQPTLDL